MSKPDGYYFYSIVNNNKIISTTKLLPQTMLDLFRFLINEFGDQDYDSVADIFNYWPVDFKAKYGKPIQCLYIEYHKKNEKFNTGFIVYARNKTNAEKALQAHLENKHNE